MLRLSVSQMIAKISELLPFEAVSEDYSFYLKIESYSPYVCAAVHEGHQFRKSLWKNCLHAEYDRWYEEDPCTKEMIHTHPIVIAGADSRFEYDLNRPPEGAIYADAWGKQLWKEPLSKNEYDLSLSKHNSFYKVVDALLGQIETLFSKAIVFDMHSYNWQRWNREVPTWNLGTTNLDNERFGSTIVSWQEKLASIKLPHDIKSDCKINDTFQGNGYFLKHITANFNNTLVLATEISKIYCDESSGIIFPEVVRSVALQLKELIPLQAKEFQVSDL